MPLAQQGVFVNVNELEYTNFDQPWYIKDMDENYGINGKFYGIISDHSLSLYKDMSVIFFNSTIWRNPMSTSMTWSARANGHWTNSSS